MQLDIEMGHDNYILISVFWVLMYNCVSSD